MLLSDVPIKGGVPRPEFAFKITGKSGGTMFVGSPAESADGKEWTALAGDPTDLAGIVVFDNTKDNATGFVTDDIVDVLVLGVISVIASAAIAAGARITGAASGKVATSTDPGSAEIKNYLGFALTDAASDGDIIWALIMPTRDTGIT